MESKKIAVITGFGAGLSEELAKRLINKDYIVCGLSRTASFGNQFAEQYEHFHSYACDVTDNTQVNQIFTTIQKKHGNIDCLIHNAAELLLKPFSDITPEQFEQVWKTSVLGAFNVSQAVISPMAAQQSGTIIFTGATASIKGGPKAAAFASAKFALRGLAQSLARAYGKEGVHIVHTIIDGVIWGDRAENTFKMNINDCMSAQDIADTYLTLIEQKPSAWTHEIDLRPAHELF